MKTRTDLGDQEALPCRLGTPALFPGHAERGRDPGAGGGPAWRYVLAGSSPATGRVRISVTPVRSRPLWLT